jgi:ABC-type lipoprotein export system ATPase subunit
LAGHPVSSDDDVAVTSTAGTASGTARDQHREPIVQLRDVFCVHRTSEGDAAALQGTTLDVQRGELLCVLGPSGAGKSTLLRVIAGLQTPSAGIVQVLGRDIGRVPVRLRARLRHSSIGFLGQDADAVLAPDLRVRDAVAMPLSLRRVQRRAALERVRELLEAAGLSERADALPRELSGGERQRIAVCAALAHRPSLLLADEPTGELDARSAETVRALIADLTRAHGTTAILVSHDPATAEFADRSVRLRDGRVVEDRRGGDDALVVGRGGWLQLPPELLRAAGIGDRARVRRGPDGLLVSPVPGASPEPHLPAAPALAAAVTAGGWERSSVELRSLHRSRGRGARRRNVIGDLTREFPAGRMTAVTGRSGSGKTTLLRLIAGIDAPDSGELLLDRHALQALDAEQRASIRRARVGYLPQEPSPVAFLSAEENVVLALRLRGWGANAAARRATVVLAWVGLSDRARQRVARLSAGEAQRVALARALASARGLLVVDEPTSRLDQAGAATIAELLAAAAVYDHQTVICATHDPQVIRHADEVLALP